MKKLVSLLLAAGMVATLACPTMVSAEDTTATSVTAVRKITMATNRQTWNAALYEAPDGKLYVYSLEVNNPAEDGGLKVYDLGTGVAAPAKNDGEADDAYLARQMPTDITPAKDANPEFYFKVNSDNPGGLKIIGDKLYCSAGADGGNVQGVRIYDLSQAPDGGAFAGLPKLESVHATGQATGEIQIVEEGKTAFVTTGSKLMKIDLATPNSPAVVVASSTSSSGKTLQRVGDYLFELAGGKVYVYRLEQADGAADAVLVGTKTITDLGAMAYSMVAVGDYLYIGSWNSYTYADNPNSFAMAILDISDPAQIADAELTLYTGKEYDRVHNPGENKNRRMNVLVTDGTRLYSSTTDGAYLIFDVSEPTRPNYLTAAAANSGGVLSNGTTYGISLAQVGGLTYMVIPARGGGISIYQCALGDEPQVLEAEGAEMSGAMKKSSTLNVFSNKYGVVGMVEGDTLTFRYPSFMACEKDISLAYATGQTDINISVTVNGGAPVEKLLPKTSHNSNDVRTEPLGTFPLVQGENTIVITATHAGLSNDLFVPDCLKISNVYQGDTDVLFDLTLSKADGGSVTLPGDAAGAPLAATVDLRAVVREATSPIEDAVFVMGCYKDGVLAGVTAQMLRISEAGDKQKCVLPVTIPQGTTQVRGYVWNSGFAKMVPLSDAVTLPAN